MAERVWERFLTEQDKATLVRKADRRVGFGERPALLLIDLYRWVFGDKPEPVTEAIKTWPGSCGLAGWDAIPHIQKLLAKAREVGIPVIHVTGLDGVAVEPWAFRRDGKKRATMSKEDLDRFQTDTGRNGIKENFAERVLGNAVDRPSQFSRRRYHYYLRREHQRLRACERGRWHHESYAHDRRRRVRLRPARGLSRH